MTTTSRATTTPNLDSAIVQKLQESLRGDVVQPGHSEYDSARTIYNAMIDKRPAVIVRCAGVSDVIHAVNFARENDLILSIKGGGHNVSGSSLCDGGIVIDLSQMKSVRVDPKRQTARVEGGATWRDMDHATHAFGLATPAGIIGTTGVAGLTLGGGFGHLSRHYGLSCDNLLSADVVTADGRLVTASKDENPDLFWALRGGGGNFGVVTSFEFQLHPVDTVYGGPIFYPIEETEKLLRFYRDYMRQAPDEMSAFFSFHQGPPAPFIPEHLHFVPMVAIVTCYSGALEDGEEAIRPLRAAATPAVDLAGPIPYPALNGMFDDLFSPGLYHYWKADFVPELKDEAIAVHTEYGPQIPSLHSTMHLYPQTGAIQRVGKDESAYSYRDMEYVHNVVAVDMEEANMPRNMTWMREYWDALHPHSAAGTYVNFMMEDEGQDRVKATYRDNYDRLTQIKKTWDPDNLFKSNQNIRPKA
ncbi:MAG: FAD-binding oxidoreductase [Chloroflexia bacterium]|nr:FAD-binding oxidoreductase [Chloroflexia bacterium]